MARERKLAKKKEEEESKQDIKEVAQVISQPKTDIGTAPSQGTPQVDGFEQFLQTVVFEVDTQTLGSGKTYTATYSKVYLEVSNLSESADGNTIEVTGEVYGGVAYVQA